MDKIIYTQLTGQLGNHLFQVATAYGLSKDNLMNIIICYNDYNIYESMYINSILKHFKCIKTKDINLNNCSIYSEKNNNINCWLYNPDIIKNKNNYYLDGYFQNEKYFQKYKNELKNLFIDQEIIKRLTYFNGYFIHVRRGDYVNNKNYLTCDDNYFELGIEYIKNKDPTAEFCVISDDKNYCKQHHLFKNFIFIDLDAIDTLHFMTMVKGGITSNSSFSWWGSYLNFNKDKIIVMPKKWMGNSNIFDIWPENTIIM